MIKKIILVSVDDDLADAWTRFNSNLANIVVHRGSIFDLDVDAVVSPANSFGFMDGGLDGLYTKHFGQHVQDRLQTLIRDNHGGELVVGAAEIVPTNDYRIPYLISAPTMRVPMILGAETCNPYLAARAALRLVRYGTMKLDHLTTVSVADHVKSIAFPGLGTGVGCVPAEICAKQVRLAIQSVVFNLPPFPASWGEAQLRHQEMYTDRFRDLQYIK